VGSIGSRHRNNATMKLLSGQANPHMTRTLWSIATFVLLAACMHPRTIEAPAEVQLTPLQTISTLKARLLLTLAGVDGISVTNSVDCYRLQYTVGAGSEAVQLSGLLALPRGVVPRRLVSFQHGTSTTRTDPRTMFNQAFLDAFDRDQTHGISSHSPPTVSSTSRRARRFGSTMDRRISMSFPKKLWQQLVRCVRGKSTSLRSTSARSDTSLPCWPPPRSFSRGFASSTPPR
jgi:hypothetical protein